MAIRLRKPHAPKPSTVAAPNSIQSSSSPEQLLTIKEAMDFAKVSDATIRRWIRNKQLQAYRVGGQVRIDEADLVKFLQPWAQKKTCE
jgi:excisionase family DNA binding protein